MQHRLGILTKKFMALILAIYLDQSLSLFAPSCIALYFSGIRTDLFLYRGAYQSTDSQSSRQFS